MKLIAQIKLQPDQEQSDALKATVEQANSACNRISASAWDYRTFGKFKLQKALYHLIKQEFGLSAQMVVKCFAKVADAYALDKKTQRSFKPLGSIAYDDRILTFKLDKSLVPSGQWADGLKYPSSVATNSARWLKSGKGNLTWFIGRVNFICLSFVISTKRQRVTSAVFWESTSVLKTLPPIRRAKPTPVIISVAFQASR
jgi:predicted transposase